MPIFAIITPSDFHAKVQEDVRLLDERIDDSSRAMNAILSGYHLHEWIWAGWLKAASPKTLRGTVIRDKAGFLAWLETHCPHFLILQSLANGTKHCSPVDPTGRIAGYGSGPFGVGPYGTTYLLIDRGDTFPPEERWLVASTMLREVSAFWEQFFTDNAPIP